MGKLKHALRFRIIRDQPEPQKPYKGKRLQIQKR